MIFRDPDFFIVGLQKSGTYGLSALLDAHPQIRCLPNHPIHSYSKGKTGADEGRIFDMLASVDYDGGTALKSSFQNHHGGFFQKLVPLIGQVSKEELHRAIKARYQEWFIFHNPENKPIVGDKTTEYVFHLDLLDQFFPQAKKICLIRDPKDRVVSWHFHQIRKGRRSENQIDDQFVKDYVENQIKREYRCLKQYPDFIYKLTYKNLQNEPKKVLIKLLHYLGASTEESLLDQMLKTASFENLKAKEIVYLKQIGETVAVTHYREGKIGDWRNYLSKEQAKFIDENCFY